VGMFKSVRPHNPFALLLQTREGRIVFHVHINHRVPTPSPHSSTAGKADRNHLNEKITPILPTGIIERFSETISNLGHKAGGGGASS
jgi:hypothetical protein